MKKCQLKSGRVVRGVCWGIKGMAAVWLGAICQVEAAGTGTDHSGTSMLILHGTAVSSGSDSGTKQTSPACRLAPYTQHTVMEEARIKTQLEKRQFSIQAGLGSVHC